MKEAKAMDIINFFNTCNLEELIDSLNELDEKIKEIFEKKEAYIESLVVNILRNKDAYFFVWFCFLKGNFLRGWDVVSNKKFREFLNFAEKSKYYFDSFPYEGNFLPHLNWRYAKGVEEVFQHLKNEKNVRSGKKFVKKIKEISEKNRDTLLLYLEVIRYFQSIKGIGNKIANAILGEIMYELYLLKKYGENETVENILKEEWMKNLFFASFFNVMIDTHVKNFFKKKFGFKDIDQNILLLLAKKWRKRLFELYLIDSLNRFLRKMRNRVWTTIGSLLVQIL